MSAITPIEFIRFCVEQGHTFEIAFMDDEGIGEEILEVNKDNFVEFAKRMEEKRCHS